MTFVDNKYCNATVAVDNPIHYPHRLGCKIYKEYILLENHPESTKISKLVSAKKTLTLYFKFIIDNEVPH